MSDAPMSRRTALLWALAATLLWAVAILTASTAPEADGVMRADPGTAGLLIASVALSYWSAQLAAKKGRSPLPDDNAVTTVERGAFIHYVVGRQRLGPLILWVEGGGSGPSYIGPTGGAAQGGKRGSRSGGNFKGRVWHGLCVGPASRIRRIWFNGKVVATGVLTPEYVPSGASVSIAEGTFRIYWGERDQPVDPLLSSNLVASRWPYLCSVVWDQINLGDTPQHPLIEYEVEVQPHGSQLVQSPAWIVSNATDPGAASDLATSGTGSGPHVAIIGKHIDTFTPQSIVMLCGTEATRIFGVSQVYADVAWSTYSAAFNVTTVRLGNQTSRTVDNQSIRTQPKNAICLMTMLDDDGVNYAHAIDHMLFSQWPWGASKNRDKWDVDSLEQLGILCYQKNDRGDIIASDGELVEAKLGQMLQDFSIAMPWDYDRGKYVFIPVREPVGDLPTIPEELILPTRPEIESASQELANQLVFEFSDRTQNYRKMTLVAQNPGNRLANRRARVMKVQIASTTHFATAVGIAYRRAQEELANKSKYRIFAQRDARYLTPGRAIQVAGIPEVLRHLSNKIDVLSARTELNALVDVFGVPPRADQDLVETTGDHFGASGEGPEYPAPDVAVGVFELPRLYEDEEIKILVLRARSSDRVIAANIYISTDGNSYQLALRDDQLHTAIELTAPLAETLLETDGVGDQLGVDVALVGEDLGGSEESWRLGRQIAVCGNELMYLKSLTSLGGDSFSLDSLLRGRLGTPVEEHADGATVFIAQSHELRPIASPLFQPGRTIYVKVAPITASGGELSLDLCPEHTITIQNLAWTPLAPVSLRTEWLTPIWEAGGEISLRWCYFSTEWPLTGCGMQGAGDPTPTSPVQGEFQVELWEVGGLEPVVDFFVDTPHVVIDNALLVAEFAGEPTELEVRVYNVFAGHRSAAATLTLTRS